MAEALAADAASSAAGCEAHSAGSLTTMRGRTRGVAGSTPRAWRWPRVISAALSVVGIAAATAPRAAASALATSTTRPPPSATEVALDGAEQVAGHLVDAAGRHVVHGGGAGDDGGRRRCARGSEQHVAVAEQVRRLGQRAAPEAHDRARRRAR